MVPVLASVRKFLLPHPISAFLWAAECHRTIPSRRLAIHLLLPQILAVIREPSSIYLLRTQSSRPRAMCSRSIQIQKTIYSHLTRPSWNRITRITKTTSSHSRSHRAVSSIKRPINSSRRPHKPVLLDSQPPNLSAIYLDHRRVSNKRSNQCPTCSVSQGLCKTTLQAAFSVLQGASRNKRSLVPTSSGILARSLISQRPTSSIRTLL